MRLFLAMIRSAVHPHACGENLRATDKPASRVGSPPRLWGKHVPSSLVPPLGRFTPTLVGKTKHTELILFKYVVHPHACGENPGVQSLRQRLQGSPPRLWGKLGVSGAFDGLGGFTPTLVGKTDAYAPAPSRQ